MEIILRSEILYKSPEFHKKIREKLKLCTGCIVSSCNESSLAPCVEKCMEPCTAFKLSYESKKTELLEQLKNEMLSACLHNPDQESCKRSIVSKYRESISSLFESPN